MANRDTLATTIEKPKVLTAKELRTIMPRLTGWKLAQNKLARTFEFTDFVQSLSFLNSLVAYFETVDHHPDVHIAYGEVTFELTRYDAGGKVTDRDVEVAKEDFVRVQKHVRRPKHALIPILDATAAPTARTSFRTNAGAWRRALRRRQQRDRQPLFFGRAPDPLAMLHARLARPTAATVLIAAPTKPTPRLFRLCAVGRVKMGDAVSRARQLHREASACLTNGRLHLHRGRRGAMGPVPELLSGLEFQPFKRLTQTLTSVLQAQLRLANRAEEQASR